LFIEYSEIAMKKRILMCSLVVALAPAGMLLATSSTALAQTLPLSRTVTPAIEGFHVEKVPRLEQGAALHFHVYGTRNATVNVSIEGATRGVQMQETDPAATAAAMSSATTTASSQTAR
jgi:hypothetical protein